MLAYLSSPLSHTIIFGARLRGSQISTATSRVARLMGNTFEGAKPKGRLSGAISDITRKLNLASTQCQRLNICDAITSQTNRTIVSARADAALPSNSRLAPATPAGMPWRTTFSNIPKYPAS